MNIVVKGKEILIDDADLSLANNGRGLFITKNGFVIYPKKVRQNLSKHIYIHKAIMGAGADVQVDHINGNRLDNRRCNLRICTHAENQRNKAPRKDKKHDHPYKGISPYWITSKGRRYQYWRAKCVVNGKAHVCSRKDMLSAARAYDELAKKHHGEFARLNFPEAT